MTNDTSLRDHLLSLLQGEGAHLNFEAAIRDFPAEIRGQRPENRGHSPWEILEHMRIAQWDILEFTRNAKHRSPAFPSGYWPTAQAPPKEADWDRSVADFRADLAAIIARARDESTDLFAPIPHGSGQTVLREMLLVADHNAYHLGQLALVRKLLGAGL